jgi:hypothetical protein
MDAVKTLKSRMVDERVVITEAEIPESTKKE